MFKTTKITLSLAGLLAVVAMVIMAVGASAAFATEFKTESGSFPDGFAGKGAVAELTTAAHVIECTSSESKGEAAASNLADKIQITYKGCNTTEIFNVTCQSGTESGTIVTDLIDAEPVDIGGTGTEIGLLFKAASGTTFAEFECGGIETIRVTGEIECETSPANTLSLTGEVICAQTSNGKQTFGGTAHHLTSENVGSKTTEEAAQKTTETLTFKEKIEQTRP